jgi:hypothetical protein
MEFIANALEAQLLRNFLGSLSACRCRAAGLLQMLFIFPLRSIDLREVPVRVNDFETVLH